eukprot:2157677-Rhodomonas_salina.1
MRVCVCVGLVLSESVCLSASVSVRPPSFPVPRSPTQHHHHHHHRCPFQDHNHPPGIRIAQEEQGRGADLSYDFASFSAFHSASCQSHVIRSRYQYTLSCHVIRSQQHSPRQCPASKNCSAV